MFSFTNSFIIEFIKALILAFMGTLLPSEVEETNGRIGNEIISRLNSIPKVQGLDNLMCKECDFLDLFDKKTSSVVGFLFKKKGQLFLHSPVDGRKFSAFDKELVGGRPDGTILTFTFTEVNDRLINGSCTLFSPATEYWTEVDGLYDECDRDILEGVQFMLFKDENIAAQVKITKEKVFVSQNDHGKQVPFSLFDQALEVKHYDDKYHLYRFTKKDNNKVEIYEVKG